MRPPNPNIEDWPTLVIPPSVYLENLWPSAVVVWGVLNGLEAGDRKLGTNAQIADALGISERHFYRCLLYLQDAGLLELSKCSERTE